MSGGGLGLGMWITLFGFVIMSGTRWIGDNPHTTFTHPTFDTLSPTFYHRYGYVDIVMTTFFPLTLSGRPFFYYICFPDKKGVSSVMGGGTSLRVL